MKTLKHYTTVAGAAVAGVVLVVPLIIVVSAAVLFLDSYDTAKTKQWGWS